MIKYDVAKALGSNSLKDVKEKLEAVKKLTGRDGKVFIDTLRDTSSLIDPRILDEYGDEDNFYYTVSLQAVVGDLYEEDIFGFNLTEMWDEYYYPEFEELLEMCYVYITTYMTSEKEFLEDLLDRIATRNWGLLMKLEGARSNSLDNISGVSDEKGVNSLFETKKVTLESLYPSKYDDLTLDCIVLDGEDVQSYISLMPNNETVMASDNGSYYYEPCIWGGTIETHETVMVDGKEYIKNRQVEEVARLSDDLQFDENISDYELFSVEDTDEDEFESDYIGNPYGTPMVVRSVKRPNSTRFIDSEEFGAHFDTEEYRDTCYSIDEPRNYVKIANNAIINGTLVLKDSYISMDEYGNVVSVVDGDTFANSYSIIPEYEKVKYL